MSTQLQLEDGRRWNGLAYVHDALVAGCNCASCLGYFQVPVTGLRADGSRVPDEVTDIEAA